ncbi:hypothetical protein [Spirosoma lituiforme]
MNAIGYKVLIQQSLFDIAIEVYGDVEGIFWLLADNPQLIGLTDRLQPDQTLHLREDKINPRQADELDIYGPFQTIDETDKPMGIGYWRTEEYKIG